MSGCLRTVLPHNTALPNLTSLYPLWRLRGQTARCSGLSVIRAWSPTTESAATSIDLSSHCAEQRHDFTNGEALSGCMQGVGSAFLTMEAVR